MNNTTKMYISFAQCNDSASLSTQPTQPRSGIDIRLNTQCRCQHLNIHRVLQTDTPYYSHRYTARYLTASE